MILPIVAYGDPVLRKVSKDIDKDYPDLDQLIENMWETMYASHGVGLAAPQIGRAIRLFVIDTEPFSDDEDLSEQERSQLAESKMVFINAKIIEETGEEWSFNEGCLSIPDIREEVMRQPTVTIEFCDENFEKKTQTFDGILARVIQHEYDHIEGKLFTDKLSSFKRKILEKKLIKISKGNIKTSYSMKFFKN